MEQSRSVRHRRSLCRGALRFRPDRRTRVCDEWDATADEPRHHNRLTAVTQLTVVTDGHHGGAGCHPRHRGGCEPPAQYAQTEDAEWRDGRVQSTRSVADEPE